MTRNVINVKKIDLSQKLHPESIYSKIVCRKSAKLKIETILCLHDILFEGLSKEIWKEGRVEPYILDPFVEILSKNPDLMVINIGANIGN